MRTPSSANSERTITAPVVRGSALRGLVLSRAGPPIAGARVEFRCGALGSDPVTTETDARGAFRFRFATSSRRRGVLEVSHGAYFGHARRVSVGDSLIVHMDELAAIAGRVVAAANGNAIPIESVRVLVSPRGDRGPWRTLSPSSWHSVPGLAAGRFRVHVRTRHHVRVVVATEAFAPVSSPPLLSRSGAGRHLVLRARDGTPITGRLLDGGGDPVAGADVSVVAADAPEAPVARASSGSDGRFSTGPLPDGRYTVEARSPAHLVARAEELDVARGRPAPDVKLRLASGGRVRGTVRVSSEGTAPRLKVVAKRLDRPEPRWQRGRVAPVSGRDFTFSSMLPGTYRFELRGESGPPLHTTRRQVAAGRTTLVTLGSDG